MKEIAIIGGGAAGVFAAISAAEMAKTKSISTKIDIFESSSRFLTKVLISGGGRCNVTHHNFEPNLFCKSYPRGNQELISPMHQFQAKDMVEWLENRGVKLKTESDGRIFPTTDNSETVVNCLLLEAERYGIQFHTRSSVNKISHSDSKFKLTVNKTEAFSADMVLVATGSSPVGYRIAAELGHTIEELAPSLFSFNIEHPLLKGLEGTSFPSAEVYLHFSDGKKFQEKAPVLITHWGLSGPGILKLSAWAAREMKKHHYQATLFVNWTGLKNLDEALRILHVYKEKNSKSNIANIYPPSITRKFWEKLLTISKIEHGMQWAHATKAMIEMLAEYIARCEFQISGKSRNKEEFVECGGVSRKEINWKTMESKICKGLYFAGEVIDVDGITGGFNLQHAWTTGYITGKNMIE